MKIGFFGDGPWAERALQRLAQDQRYTIVFVAVRASRPDQKLIALAKKNGVPVLCPASINSAESLAEIGKFAADLHLSMSYDQIFRENILGLPPRGTLNCHAGALPFYRGRNPLTWAIINGETETGVTTFFLQHEIDTGKIIFQEKEPILDDDNVGSLYERLKVKGSEVVLKTVQAIAEGTAPSIPQIAPIALRSAPKIFKETCELHWTETAAQVRNKVRGLSPYPGAWSTLNEKIFKILSVSLSDSNKSGSPGDLDTDGKTYVRVCTTQGWITIDELQPEGKRKMKIREFLAGNKL